MNISDWGPDDVARARADGWQRRGRVVARSFRPDGSAVFHSDSMVYEHIHRQAATCDWYRKTYFALPWGFTDAEAARKEGWVLVLGVGQLAALWLRSPRESATDHLLEAAERDSVLHMKALRTLSQQRFLRESQ